VVGLERAGVAQEITVRVERRGEVHILTVTAGIDTPAEAATFRHGCVLSYVLRQIL
jgi:aconitate hydratase